MPSFQHEAILELFRNRPALVPELLRDALHIPLPDYTKVCIESADLSDIKPTEYRADLVILLLRGSPVLGIVLEIQLSRDEDKRYSWPAYVTNLRTRIRCPVCLFVVTPEESVAQWAGKTIDLGAGNFFTPCVLGPLSIPEISDKEGALKDPELAVLSAMAYAKDPDTMKSARMASLAQMACVEFDTERSMLYCDLILKSLPEAARWALQTMDASKYEYQSEFARRYYGQGKTEGREEGLKEGRREGRLAGHLRGHLEGLEEGHAEGCVRGSLELVLKQLATKYGTLSATVAERVRRATAADLDGIAERVLTAETLDEALGLTRAQS